MIWQVAIGGAVGAVARYGWMALTRSLWPGFPWPIMAANVLGSVLMGVLAGLLARFMPPASDSLRAFIGVGVLGGFTTFSTFSLEAYLLYERGSYGAAACYVLGSVLLSIAGLGLGLWWGRAWLA